jgi:hypothetical protein
MKPGLSDPERKALIRHLRRPDATELPTDVRTIDRNGRKFIIIAAKGVTTGIYALRPDLNSMRRQDHLPRRQETDR